jgi:hypothetical protein
MPIRTNRDKLYAFDDGTPTPPCRMCGNPRRRVNTGWSAPDHVAAYCGGNQCVAETRICQRAGCGASFAVGPGASRYCPDHTPNRVVNAA